MPQPGRFWGFWGNLKSTLFLTSSTISQKLAEEPETGPIRHLSLLIGLEVTRRN